MDARHIPNLLGLFRIVTTPVLYVLIMLGTPAGYVWAVVLDVPVEIPLANTELGPQFKRLGDLVDRLAGPAAPLLGLDIPEAPPAPQVTPATETP